MTARVAPGLRIGVVPPSSDTLAFHQRLSGYAPTPLRDASSIAAGLGLDRLLVKDESRRFGLPAFKFLGASWAVARLLGGSHDLAELRTEAKRLGVERLVTATDGNHGRAVARMASLLGLRATIYVPPTVVAARCAAIAGEGADVHTVDGDYDAAVRAAMEDAASDRTARAVNDADLDGSSPVGEWVIEGYGSVFAEIDEQVDLVVLQIGVGGFAAAGARWAAARGIRAIGAEPAGSPCVTESFLAGEPITIAGTHTIMGCLEAGTPSAAAWPTLRATLECIVALEDDESDDAARRLAAIGVEAGESGAAGLAGLVALMTDPALAGYRRDVRSALVVVTEGATDPERYAAITAGVAPS